MMTIAGLLSGLLGIGSGTFKVLAMDTAMRLPMKVSTTTSNFMIGVTAAASAGIYFQRGDINPLYAAPVALGVLLGATIGRKDAGALQQLHPAQNLRPDPCRDRHRDADSRRRLPDGWPLIEAGGLSLQARCRVGAQPRRRRAQSRAPQIERATEQPERDDRH